MATTDVIPSFSKVFVSQDSSDSLLIRETRSKGLTKTEEKKKQEAAKKREKVEPKIKDPQRYLADPNNLHFETAVKCRVNELVVPAQLVKDNCLRFGVSPNLKQLSFTSCADYIDAKGKLRAERAKYKSRSSVLFKKWVLICRRNELKKEDRVLCELLRKRDVVRTIRVHIIRGIDL